MVWQIEFERPLDGAVLIDSSATDKDSAIKTAFALIESGHDVRGITSPDGTRVGAAAVADAYLDRSKLGAVVPAHSRVSGPATNIDESIRPGELRGPNPAANIDRPPRRRFGLGLAG
jgi:hypothetical protein